jgi:hypothetical protein
METVTAGPARFYHEIAGVGLVFPRESSLGWTPPTPPGFIQQPGVSLYSSVRLVSRGQFLGEYSDSSPLFFGPFPGVLSSGYLPRQFIERAQGLFVNNTSLSHRGEYLGNFWPKHRGGA